jgi:hypothetical protein
LAVTLTALADESARPRPHGSSSIACLQPGGTSSGAIVMRDSRRCPFWHRFDLRGAVGGQHDWGSPARYVTVMYRSPAIGESATKRSRCGMDLARRLQLREVEISRACSRRAGAGSNRAQGSGASACVRRRNGPLAGKPAVQSKWLRRLSIRTSAGSQTGIVRYVLVDALSSYREACSD